MWSKEVVTSLLSVVFAGIFLIGALKYGFGALSKPGPGLVPFFASVFVIILATINFFTNLGRRDVDHQIKVKFLPEKSILIRLVIAVTSLIGFGVAFEYFGFCLTTLVFMAVVLKFVALKENWASILGTSLLITSAAYFLFVVLLQSPLPQGIFL